MRGLKKLSLLTLILSKELSKMYFTKTQTIETFKEIYADDLKELFGQKKILKLLKLTMVILLLVSIPHGRHPLVYIENCSINFQM